MSIPAELERLVGTWRGKNLLWLSEEPIESETTATVRIAAGGTCLCIEYDWSYDNAPEQGIILLGSRGGDAVQGIWRDSWHSAGEFFISDGAVDGARAVQVLTSYSAPESPDWGWRTHVRADGEDRFEILMVNISPEGEETPAVLMDYRRTVSSVA